MKKLIIPFAIVANFLIVGCGGGSSYSTVDDGVPAPTAELKQDQTADILNKIAKTKLDPEMLIAYTYAISSGNSNTLNTTENNNTDNSVKQCLFGGTITHETISGKSKNNDSNATSGGEKYKLIYNDCEILPGITENGTINIADDWNKEENYIIKYSATINSKNFVYRKDDKNKFTISFSKKNSGKYCKEHGHSDGVCYDEGTSVNEYSGKFISNSDTLEFKNIKTETKFKKNYREPYDYYRYFKTSGAIKSSELKGWIVIQTPTPFEKNEKDKVDSDPDIYCWHTGKLVIKGENHTLTQEVNSDHSIVQKFDDKVVKKYTNCLNY